MAGTMRPAYAGVGSRATPEAVLDVMRRVAVALRRLGFVLRSGGAQGADQAFEAGSEGYCEIFLPWTRFNGHPSRFGAPRAEAFEIAAQHHAGWDRLSSAAKRLHARNAHQVLGPELNDPVSFLVCWTPNGAGGGGTGQAIRIARAWEVPVFDLGAGCRETLEMLGKHVRKEVENAVER